VPALRRRLAASGDLPPSRARARVAAARYGGDLVAAVRRFQARHGLHPDGIVGAATIAALNVSAAERARQVTLNLERWRWLPRALEARHIAVNAAAATLEAVEANRAVLTSRVVVGEPRFPTPVLRASVEAVVVNPPWRVPPSIATGEILPRLREDRWYLADNEIVILERWDSDAFGLGIDWSTVSAEPFPFRLWQRPGPANPLGRLKLDMPNRFHVHLHDTPARSLFEGPVRAASHGCVRVERARALAAWVLDTPGAGEKPDVEAMIAAGATRRVAVPAPVPVYLLYWTAFVDAEGVLHFRDDVYGRDARLAAALEGRPAAPAIPGPAPAGCPPDTDGRG
jgi:murein L,D-transpeptidase YcbB/YkuD